MTHPMPRPAPISSACPAPCGPAPITSCSASTSALMSRSTSTMRDGLMRRSMPRHRWMLYVAMRTSVNLHPIATRQLSLLPFENPDERADDLLPERTAAPHLERDLAARFQIPIVILTDAFVHDGVAHGDVHLVVVLERAGVDVRRPDDGPQVVHDQDL